jgi:hypothetical protein
MPMEGKHHTRRADGEEFGQEQCHRDEAKQTTSPAEQTMSNPLASIMKVMMMIQQS